MYRYYPLLALAALSLAVFAPPGFSAVTGVVTTTGAPLEFATVMFTDQSGKGYRGYTDEQGKYTIDLSVPTGIDTSAPFTFSLEQNFPNPFNPTTTIPFTLDSPGRVQLDIYNVMGQRVATVINDYLNTGRHTATWNGMDDRGNHAGAGIYLYRLRADNKVETKKMLLFDGGGVSGSATGARYTAKSAAGMTYTVTVTHFGTIPYEKSGMSVADGQTMDFVVSRKAGTTIISGLTFVSIPSGTAILGQTGYDYCDSSHAVTISRGFEMSVTEITQGQYRAVIGSNPSGFSGDDNLPVETVDSWDAKKFCNALSIKAGLNECYDDSTYYCDFSANGFRLPTEEEWEYACRAGTTTLFNLGNFESDLALAGWYTMNSNGRSHPVGQKVPNAWGLYDMHGNILELCNNWDGYDNHGTFEITGGTEKNPSSPAQDYLIETRGGAWSNGSLVFLYSACRSPIPDIKMSIMGFRIVRRP
jgi:formylglycine-generating enzyme required for sulfatase activity